MSKVFAEPGPQSTMATASATAMRPVASKLPARNPVVETLSKGRPLLTNQESVAFLATLRRAVVAAANEELVGTEWTAEQCPWIEYWFSYYSTRDVRDVEGALRKYAPEARAATSAEYVEPVVARVRTAIQKWRSTGEVDTPARIDVASAAMSSDAALAAMGALRGGEQPRIPAAVASTLGGSFSDVRIHTDGAADQLASRAGALAYTVGNHVVYAASTPRPGSPIGDALLAHELAHVRQQRGVAGVASVTNAEENADQAVAHAAAATFGIRGMAVGAWNAVAAPLGLQRCNSNKAELAEKQKELTAVQAVLAGPDQRFGTIGGAITRRTALEHWIAVLNGGRGPRTGTDAPEVGVDGCNCTTYVVAVLSEAFSKAGRNADWKKVLERTYKIKGVREVDGVELQSALRSELGWKAIFWAPDPHYASYRRRPRPYDHAPPGTEFVHDTENKERYDLATRANKPVYRITPGKKSENDLGIEKAVMNYAPERANRAITTPVDSTSPKDTSQLDKLVRLPFGVLTAQGGTHMALIIKGVVYEVHWAQHSDDVRLYASTPLEEWGWGSGIIVAPAEDVDKAFE